MHRSEQSNQVATFQQRVLVWLMACFSMEVCRNRAERNHRFLEEALELVQALDCTCSEAHQLVDYVFDRPPGDPKQELGGVMVTLAALCFPNGLDMNAAAEVELDRVWEKIDIIRAKQAAKPKHSPLPEAGTLDWAVGRWRAEVMNRPLNNQSRRPLDDTWRQVIRHLGGDDVALCGPPHDALLEMSDGQ